MSVLPAGGSLALESRGGWRPVFPWLPGGLRALYIKCVVSVTLETSVPAAGRGSGNARLMHPTHHISRLEGLSRGVD